MLIDRYAEVGVSLSDRAPFLPLWIGLGDLWLVSVIQFLARTREGIPCGIFHSLGVRGASREEVPAGGICVCADKCRRGIALSRGVYCTMGLVLPVFVNNQRTRSSAGWVDAVRHWGTARQRRSHCDIGYWRGFGCLSRVN